MLKTQKIITGSITLMSFQILFFLCNYYPRHIIETCDNLNVWQVIFNIVAFLIFDFLIVYLFSKNNIDFENSNPDSKIPLFKRYSVIKFIAVIAIQLCAELLIYFSKTNLGNGAYILQTIITASIFPVFYAVTSEKNHNFLKNKNILSISAVIFIVILAASVIFDLQIINGIEAIERKYNSDSFVLISEKTNSEYFWEIKALIFDILISVLIVISHFLSIDFPKVEDDGNEPRKRVAFILRSFFIIDVFVIATVLKFAVIPEATLQSSMADDGKETFYIDNSEAYISEYKKYTLLRGKGESETPFFTKNDSSFYAVNGKPFSSSSAAKRDFEQILINGEKKELQTKIDFEERTSLFLGKYIGYFENEIPQVASVYELVNFNYNSDVITLCKKLLSDGNIYYFEYFCDYFLKNDAEFIKQYVERYSEGAFTEQENEFMKLNHYKSDYVINIAKSIPKKTVIFKSNEKSTPCLS